MSAQENSADPSGADALTDVHRSPSRQPGGERSGDGESGPNEPGATSRERLIADAKAAADRLPDVRSERVARARERVARGYYDTPEGRETLVSRLADLVRELL